MLMVCILRIALLGLASWGVAHGFSFRSPSLSHARVIPSIDTKLRRRPRNLAASPTSSSSEKFQERNKLRLFLSKSDGDAGLTEDIESLDTDLAREIEEALSLAQDAMQDALVVETEDSPEEDIDAIANMLMEKPPSTPPPLPLPPKEEPPASVISLSLDEGDDEDTQSTLLAESASPSPVAVAAFFAETLQKKVAEEIGRLKKMIPGREEELDDIKAGIEKEAEIAVVLKKEIEDSIKEREAMVKRIEEEFAKEKELLVAQMEVASDELKVVMDQSAQNITEAKSKANKSEDGWISRIDSLKSAIEKATSEAIEINSDKEKIQQSKQSMLEKVVEEGKSKLDQFKKSFDVDIDYAKQINADFIRRADEAESMVRGAFDKINQMRTEQVALQQQIVDVEKKALEEIASLQEGLKLDDEKYAAALEKERVRLDEVIDVVYKAYAIIVCKKITERQSIEADQKDKIRNMDMQITAAREKQESRVKEYLDKLEAKHKKERIAVYQEKFDAIDAIRKEMKAELAIEHAKLEEIHETMRPQISAVNNQIAQVKADFEKEMSEKLQIAKEEEEEILREIEDVRVDMTDKIKTQRRLYDDKKSTYLDEMNMKISDSETELRQAWRDIAVIKKSYSEESAKRDTMIDDVAEKQALINSYESDRKSFRKSLRLTAKVAREKIGSKTKRLLGGIRRQCK